MSPAATIDGVGSFLVNYGIESEFTANRLVLPDFLVNSVHADDFNGIVLSHSRSSLPSRWHLEHWQ